MKIDNKKELKRIIKLEKNIYCPKSRGGFLKLLIQQDERALIYKYLVYLRKEEFYLSKNNCLYKVFRLLNRRKRNKLGNIINIKILPGLVEAGVNIHHKNIIINGHVGKNCIFHGNNCIGNNPKPNDPEDKIPTIGNEVDFGYGCIVIGDIVVASNTKIGAGAVVVSSIKDEGTVWAGVPAKRLY